jgi:hypothetical protein
VRSVFREPVQAGLLLGLLYLLLAGGVATVERHSENDKISRGTYTDTFEPLQISRGLTWPLEVALVDDWPGYPETFDATAYKALVTHTWKQTLAAALLQTVLVTTIVTAVGVAIRRIRRARSA